MKCLITIGDKGVLLLCGIRLSSPTTAFFPSLSFSRSNRGDDRLAWTSADGKRLLDVLPDVVGMSFMRDRLRSVGIQIAEHWDTG